MYKNYNKLRDVLSGKIPPPQPPQPSRHTSDNDDDDDQNRKRKPHNPHALTPSSKRFRPAETPSRTPHTNITTAAAAATTAVTPSLSRQLFSPTVPTSIGPTPQRDGRVLGLFDFLPFKDADIESPSKPNRPARAPAGGATTTTTNQRRTGTALQETPRKGKYTMDTGLGIEVDLTRTPSSRHNGRPQQQQQQQTPRMGIPATPSRRQQQQQQQQHDGDDNRPARAPSSAHSASRLQFQTPSFLRRIPMPSIGGPAGFPSPEPIRLPRKPMVRGLSSILADLRRTEEEQLDDDLDALREAEAEAEGVGRPVSTRPPADGPSQNPPAQAPAPRRPGDPRYGDSILAEDSQKQNMTLLGGFDDEAMYDSQDGGQEGVDRGGRPLKVYKKKGQKRTTRKANMRPVRTRRPSAGAAAQEHAGQSDDDDDGVVPETQLGPPVPSTRKQQPGRRQEDGDDPALLSGSEFAGSEYDDDVDELAQDHPKKPRRAAAGKPSKKESASAASKAKGGGKPDSKVKKAPRKVNELAHANFKRLKLRNSGAKGGAGFNSRFRRGR